MAYLVDKLKGLQQFYISSHCSGIEGNVDKLSCLSHSNNMEATFSISNVLRKESGNMQPEKVLIFSQFLEHIHVIEEQVIFMSEKYEAFPFPFH